LTYQRYVGGRLSQMGTYRFYLTCQQVCSRGDGYKWIHE
jgi:hypothetical protein